MGIPRKGGVRASRLFLESDGRCSVAGELRCDRSFSYSHSLFQSLVTGRPPALLTAYIDCRIPTAEDEFIFQQGEVPLGCECHKIFQPL